MRDTSLGSNMEIIHLSFLVSLCFGVHAWSSEVLQRRKRAWVIDTFAIDEGYEGPFPYLLGKVGVENEISLYKISGQGVDMEPKGVLQINSNTGEITVNRPVDYEEFQKFTVSFSAIKHNHEVDTKLGVEILILDANDHAPKFGLQIYSIKIKESTAQGTSLIIISATDDDGEANNKQFNFRIVKVTPQPQDLEFYLTQTSGASTGSLSFRGCLDHEKASKYTIVVEAKDRGEKKQLSSSCTIIVDIEDGNNHLPVITHHTGPGKVKEGQVDVLVSQLHFKDEDTKGTAGWRAKYQIHGDTKNNFEITTDPETNNGLLYVKKPLDYEEESIKHINITVDNEAPYQSCRVERRITGQLWQVANITGSSMTVAGQFHRKTAYQVTITVEDVNDPPVFEESNINVRVSENVKEKHYLVTLIARDRDVTSGNTVVYMKGDDPANWISVDPNTGIVTTINTIDREKLTTVDSIYTVTVFAVDNGKPPQTSTATLSIHVEDENDNTPSLVEKSIHVCQSDGRSMAIITASDPDVDPNSGPFNFKLHGDVEGIWAVNPENGYSVNLVKEGQVHSGHFTLMLEVSDLQGYKAFHDLSVTVCTCSNPAEPNCGVRGSPTTTFGAGGWLTLLLCCALAVLLSVVCVGQGRKEILPDVDVCESTLIKSNTETPGSDCDVDSHWKTIQRPIKNQGGFSGQVSTGGYTTYKGRREGQELIDNSASAGSQINEVTVNITDGNIIHKDTFGMQQVSGWNQQQDTFGMQQVSNVWNQQQGTFSSQVSTGGHKEAYARWKKQQGTLSSQVSTDGHKNAYARWNQQQMMTRSIGRGSRASSRYSKGNAVFRKNSFNTVAFGGNIDLLKVQINKMVGTLRAQGQELGDYEPHVYAEEGESEDTIEFDALSIPEVSFDPDSVLDLKFKNLAAICMQSDSTSTQLNEESFTFTKEYISSVNADEYQSVHILSSSIVS
ncbi:cadherin-like protein 26 [Mugil cephalus]|uniref:cadherin-like protein 26 n=1 Tax=Mugil cephalus TaxID=48193 RepID=UPI001FB5D16E|nr:cadherin-like protein 26 [Mugil cephalus]